MVEDSSGDFYCSGSMYNEASQTMGVAVVHFSRDGALRGHIALQLSELFPVSTGITQLTDGRLAIITSCQNASGTTVGKNQVLLLNKDLTVSKAFGFDVGLLPIPRLHLYQINDTTLEAVGSDSYGEGNLRLTFSIDGTPIKTRSYRAFGTNGLFLGLLINDIVHHSNGTTYEAGWFFNIQTNEIRPGIARLDKQGKILFLKAIREVDELWGSTLQELPDHTLLLCTKAGILKPSKLGVIAILDTVGTFLEYHQILGNDSLLFDNQVLYLGKNKLLFWEHESGFDMPQTAKFMIGGMDRTMKHCMLRPSLGTTTDLVDTEFFNFNTIKQFPVAPTPIKYTMTLAIESFALPTDPCAPIVHHEGEGGTGGGGTGGGAEEEVGQSSMSPIVSIYPNPVSNRQPIALDASGIPSGYYQIVLRDLTGRICAQQSLYHQSNTFMQIPTAVLSPGIYIVEIADEDSFTIRSRAKVVLQ